MIPPVRPLLPRLDTIQPQPCSDPSLTSYGMTAAVLPPHDAYLKALLLGNVEMNPFADFVPATHPFEAQAELWYDDSASQAEANLQTAVQYDGLLPLLLQEPGTHLLPLPHVQELAAVAPWLSDRQVPNCWQLTPLPTKMWLSPCPAGCALMGTCPPR